MFILNLIVNNKYFKNHFIFNFSKFKFIISHYRIDSHIVLQQQVDDSVQSYHPLLETHVVYQN